MKSKVIIDTDPGKDDALAILMLARSKNVDLLAVTTVAGNSSIENTTNNARYILDLVNHHAPIYSGAAKPLEKELIKGNVHGSNGLSGVSVTKTEPLSNNAPEQIHKIVERYPNQVTIIAIGPLTNIADLLTHHPDSSKLIKELIIMGGAISVPGNKGPVSEFNFYLDPTAAKIVLDSGIKITLVPLDICNVTPIFLPEFERLKNSDLYKPIINMMTPYIKAIKTFEGQNGALVYDALAAGFLLKPNIYTTIPMDIRVETKGEITEGMSVADLRTWGEKNINVNVVINLNRREFLNLFFELLK